eukprot:maker-scaffold1195_size56104-snap-gene-0.13 protein:Tk12019 transcript:maker-scaffold1195_size56104-snap-gene-0.13-mRNA-1 annotation:"hypothetical protein BRAFLDRAFT_121310"
MTPTTWRNSHGTIGGRLQYGRTPLYPSGKKRGTMGKTKMVPFALFCREKEQTCPQFRGQSMAQLSRSCAAYWEALDMADKATYKRRAQEMNNAPGRGGGAVSEDHTPPARMGRFDSLGRSLVALEQAQAIRDYRVGLAEHDIASRTRGPRYLTERWIFMETTVWLDEPTRMDLIGYRPCEIALVELSLAGGVTRHYNQLVDPGSLPLGFKGAMKVYSDKFHHVWLDHPDLSDDYGSIVERLRQILAVRPEEKPARAGGSCSEDHPDLAEWIDTDERQRLAREHNFLPIFVASENYEATRGAIEWLQKAAGTKLHFECYDLSRLFTHLMNNQNEHPHLRVPSMAVAQLHLNRDVLLYTPGMPCPFHEVEENFFCAGAFVARRAFLFLDLVCQALDIPKHEGDHFPHGLTQLDASLDQGGDAFLEAYLTNLSMEDVSVHKTRFRSIQRVVPPDKHILSDFIDFDGMEVATRSELDMEAYPVDQDPDGSFISQVPLPLFDLASLDFEDQPTKTKQNNAVER